MADFTSAERRNQTQWLPIFERWTSLWKFNVSVPTVDYISALVLIFFFFSSNCFFKKTKLFLCKWKLVDRELRTQMSRAGSRITRKRLTVLLEAQSTWLAPPWQSRAPISFGSKITGRCIQATTSKSLIPIITARSSSTFTTSPSLVITSAEPPTCWAPWPASSF